MVWTRLAPRLSRLPLVLAGLILRRVEPDTVTVWAALRESRTVTLRVVMTDVTATIPLLRRA